MFGSIADVRKVANTPDPVAQTPKAELDTPKISDMDDLIFNIIDDLGNRASALGMALAGKSAKAVTGATMGAAKGVSGAMPVGDTPAASAVADADMQDLGQLRPMSFGVGQNSTELQIW
jgi:hypothetical protein